MRGLVRGIDARGVRLHDVLGDQRAAFGFGQILNHQHEIVAAPAVRRYRDGCVIPYHTGLITVASGIAAVPSNRQ